LGKSPVQSIAQKAKVNRATTYVMIENLMKKGLMNSVTEGKKQFFRAESPDKLSLLFREESMAIQRKQEYLDKILPKLETLRPIEKEAPTVRYYEGIKGMKKIAEEIFDTRAEKNFRVIFSYDLLKKMFTPEEYLLMRQKRQNQNIHAMSIINDEHNDFVSTNAEVVKLPANKYEITADIAMYGDKVRIISQKGERVGLMIENKEIANTFKLLFDLAWENVNKKKKA